MRLKTWAGFLWWSSEREKSPCYAIDFYI
jgi:hypothetical protein